MKNKYTVVTAIEHDHKRCAPGKTIELDDDAAEPLLAVGALEPVMDTPEAGDRESAEIAVPMPAPAGDKRKK